MEALYLLVAKTKIFRRSRHVFIGILEFFCAPSSIYFSRSDEMKLLLPIGETIHS